MTDYGTFTEAQIEKFWSRVDKRGEDECWLWSGPSNGHGYGVCGWTTTGGVRVNTASRASTWIAYGPPAGLGHAAHSRHLCNNKACVNPKHLRWGTPLQNVHDSLRERRRAARVMTYEEAKAKREFLESDALRPTIFQGMCNFYSSLQSFDVGVDAPVRVMPRLGWTAASGAVAGQDERVAALVERATALGFGAGRRSVDERGLTGVSLFNDAMPPQPADDVRPRRPERKGLPRIPRSYGERCYSAIYRNGLSHVFGGQGYIRAVFGSMIVVTSELLAACARCKEMSTFYLASEAVAP